MPETIYMMDSEFCGECGCILRYFEVDLCDDCREELGDDENWHFDEDASSDYDDCVYYIGEDEEMIPVTRWRL